MTFNNPLQQQLARLESERERLLIKLRKAMDTPAEMGYGQRLTALNLQIRDLKERINGET